ncbi:hypothetical protein MKX03_001508, partial [Papaver bracteatum]
GNTYVALQHSHARLCIPAAKSKKAAECEKVKTRGIEIYKGEEVQLASRLLQFSSAVREACLCFDPSILCDYLYDLSVHSDQFLRVCQ